MTSLRQVASSEKTQSDKNPLWDIYDFWFAPIRQSVSKVLEMGVQYGGSLLVWKSFFPHAEIYGIDKDYKNLKIPEERMENIHLYEGNYSHPNQGIKWAVENGPYDIIIDDADHDPDNIIDTFRALSQQATRFYAIEDIDFSRDTNGMNKFLGLIKETYDGLQPSGYSRCTIQHYWDKRDRKREVADWLVNINSLHLYHALALYEKVGALV